MAFHGVNVVCARAPLLGHLCEKSYHGCGSQHCAGFSEPFGSAYRAVADASFNGDHVGAFRLDY